MNWKESLRKIRAEMEATRKELPSSPEMSEDSIVVVTPFFDIEQEQLDTEKQAKSWEENKEPK